MHAHGAAQNKKMAIEVHNGAAPVADSAASGLSRWGIARRSSQPAQQHDRPPVPIAAGRKTDEKRRGELSSDVERRPGWMDGGVGGRNDRGGGDNSEPRIIQWRVEGGCGAGNRAGQGREGEKKAMEWIDEEEKLTLRSPDWGKEEQKRWQGNRPCGNVAPTKAASSLHENPLGLEEACWCRSRASKGG